MKYTYIFLGLLVLGIMIFPVLAASNVVPAGGDVFLGEQGLNVQAGVGNTTTTVVWFAPGNNIQTSAPSASRTVNPLNFYVSPSDYSQYLGNWYLQGNITQSSLPAFVVRDPQLTMTLRDGSGNDITGQSVTQGTTVTFRIESNVYSADSRAGATPFGIIKVQTPDGTIYNAVQKPDGTTLSLNPVDINSNLVTVNSWDTGAMSGANKLYKAGTYSIWAELSNSLNTIKDNYNQVGKTTSSHVALTIASTNLKITASTGSVTLGNPFSVTVTGQPNTVYKLFVKSVGGDVAPTITPNQDNVAIIDQYTANVTTNSAGTRTVGFSTTQSTKDKTWTIRAEDYPSGIKSDEIQVTVAKGGVTILGPSTAFLGNEIDLSGTDTQSSQVYLFMIGPNLPSAGASLNNPRNSVTQGTADGTWVTVDINSDNTWSYKWQTDNLGVDAGAYTIYAVATPNNRDNLANTQYGTTSISLSKPYISAHIPSLVAAGDKITITGNAGAQNSAGLAIWVFGKNYFHYYTLSVNSDGSYSYDIPAGDTQGLAAGQYAVFVQNPMYNNVFDVRPDLTNGTVVGTYPVNNNVLFSISRLQTSDGAAALKNSLDNPAIDDVYTQGQFTIGTPTINIAPISEKMVGDKFTLQGTTNLAVGDSIQITIQSSSFAPTDKSQSGAFSGTAGTALVKVGSTADLNQFSFSVDTSTFKPDEYSVIATGVESSAASSSTLFIVKPYIPPTTVPTTVATPVPTTIVTTVPTAIPIINTTIVTPAPTKSPGFSAGIALIGLIGVAYLVTRKQN
jgi:PGF-CTERM protein